MNARGAALGALVLVAALLLGHRTRASLRDPTTRVGVAAVGVGFGLLVVWWVGVHLGVLDQASTEACAHVLGLSGTPTDLRGVVQVQRQSHPPVVFCTANGLTRRLTSTSTTENWQRTWAVAWWAVGTGLVALGIGLVRSRRRRRSTQVG